jgi:SAM-dependent methyltransferase
MAARRNRRAIAAGRVDLRQGVAEALPFPDGSFDKALQVHTLYFYSDLGRACQEVARVLRPGGRAVMAHRTDTRAARDFPAPVYRFPDEAAVRDALTVAGLACEEPVSWAWGPATVSFHIARR